MFEIGVESVPGLRNRIKELREARNLTQEALADLIGPDTSHSTIQRLESGGMRLTNEWMEAIATALKVHPAELIVEVERIAKDRREIEAISLIRQMSSDAAEAWLQTGKHLAS